MPTTSIFLNRPLALHIRAAFRIRLHIRSISQLFLPALLRHSLAEGCARLPGMPSGLVGEAGLGSAADAGDDGFVGAALVDLAGHAAGSKTLAKAGDGGYGLGSGEVVVSA